MIFFLQKESNVKLNIAFGINIFNDNKLRSLNMFPESECDSPLTRYITDFTSI